MPTWIKEMHFTVNFKWNLYKSCRWQITFFVPAVQDISTASVPWAPYYLLHFHLQFISYELLWIGMCRCSLLSCCLWLSLWVNTVQTYLDCYFFKNYVQMNERTCNLFDIVWIQPVSPNPEPRCWTDVIRFNQGASLEWQADRWLHLYCCGDVVER